MKLNNLAVRPEPVEGLVPKNTAADQNQGLRLAQPERNHCV